MKTVQDLLLQGVAALRHHEPLLRRWNSKSTSFLPLHHQAARAALIGSLSGDNNSNNKKSVKRVAENLFDAFYASNHKSSDHDGTFSLDKKRRHHQREDVLMNTFGDIFAFNNRFQSEFGTRPRLFIDDENNNNNNNNNSTVAASAESFVFCGNNSNDAKNNNETTHSNNNKFSSQQQQQQQQQRQQQQHNSIIQAGTSSSDVEIPFGATPFFKSDRKERQVRRIANVVRKLYSTSNALAVVDIGGGTGKLGELLVRDFRVPVVVVDKNARLVEKGKQQQQRKYNDGDDERSLRRKGSSSRHVHRASSSSVGSDAGGGVWARRNHYNRQQQQRRRQKQHLSLQVVSRNINVDRCMKLIVSPPPDSKTSKKRTAVENEMRNLFFGHHHHDLRRRAFQKNHNHKQQPQQQQQHRDINPLDKRCCMLGVHACGSLSDSVLAAMQTVDTVKSFFVVPCCPHKKLPEHVILSQFLKTHLDQQQQHDIDDDNNNEEIPTMFALLHDPKTLLLGNLNTSMSFEQFHRFVQMKMYHRALLKFFEKEGQQQQQQKQSGDENKHASSSSSSCRGFLFHLRDNNNSNVRHRLRVPKRTSELARQMMVATTPSTTRRCGCCCSHALSSDEVFRNSSSSNDEVIRNSSSSSNDGDNDTSDCIHGNEEEEVFSSDDDDDCVRHHHHHHQQEKQHCGWRRFSDFVSHWWMLQDVSSSATSPLSQEEKQMLDNFFDTVFDQVAEVVALKSLVDFVGSVIEPLLFLDRVAFVLESNRCDRVVAGAFLPASATPRRYGIAGLKREPLLRLE